MFSNVSQAALYCRKELGLRLVANLLLALASLHPAAVKHLARSSHYVSQSW